MYFDKNDPEVAELLIKCYKSMRVFSKTFFPNEVRSEFSILHDKILTLMDSPKKKKALAAPRGLGKTTLCKLRAIKAILYRETNFIIYLSNSASSAEMQTEAIKRLLTQSDLVKEMFGDIKVSTLGMKDSFSKQSWTAFGEVFILPRGSGQQVRGLNWMGHRPGLIIVDDLESTELVRSDEQREKLALWFFSDLMKTESKYDEPAEICYIDTIKHEDSLLQNLIDAEDWETELLSICDEKFNTFDPNYMTTEEIKQSYREHKAIGKADLFYMEYMNIPISLENAVYKTAYFRYYREHGGELLILEGQKDAKTGLFISEPTIIERVSRKELVTFVINDPARTVNKKSADSAIVVVSVSRRDHKIFIRDTWNEKVTPDEMYEELFSRILIYNAVILAVEVTGLHEFISQPLKNAMRAKNIFVVYIELNAKGDKDERISSFAPYYKMGQVFLRDTLDGALENQMMWHPKSKMKDLIDAQAYISKIMDEHALYFDPVDDEDEFGEVEDEFEMLEDEMLEDDDWRLI